MRAMSATTAVRWPGGNNWAHVLVEEEECCVLQLLYRQRRVDFGLVFHPCCASLSRRCARPNRYSSLSSLQKGFRHRSRYVTAGPALPLQKSGARSNSSAPSFSSILRRRLLNLSRLILAPRLIPSCRMRALPRRMALSVPVFRLCRLLGKTPRPDTLFKPFLLQAILASNFVCAPCVDVVPQMRRSHASRRHATPTAHACQHWNQHN